MTKKSLMKNETGQHTGKTAVLTQRLLQTLKENGYRFVLVNGLTSDNRVDYIEPRYFILSPVKELPNDPDKRGIYEPIGSSLLTEWAAQPDDRIKVMVSVVAIDRTA
jgi:hypothetical protein